VILELPVLSTQMNGIIIVNEMRWLSQGGDYELDEWLVLLSVAAVEHHAYQE